MQSGERLVALAVGAACGALAGAVSGLWARLAMRMVANGVADGVGITPEFTLPGTLLIVFTGGLIGAPAGLGYALVARRIPGPANWRGLVFALALLAIVGPFFFRIEEFFSLGRVLLFLPVFPLFGILFGLALGPAGRVVRRLPRLAQRGIVLAALGSAAMFAFAILASLFGLPGGFVM